MCINNTFYIIVVPSIIDFCHTLSEKPACTRVKVLVFTDGRRTDDGRRVIAIAHRFAKKADKETKRKVNVKDKSKNGKENTIS